MASPTIDRKKTINHGTVNQTTVAHCRVELPEHIFDAYEAQAKACGKDPELLMVERLIRCVGQTDAGLFFDNEQKRKLGLMLGHGVSDATGALQRLEPISKIDVSRVKFDVPADTLKRFVTRVPRGQTTNGYLQKIIIRALRQFVGQEPY